VDQKALDAYKPIGEFWEDAKAASEAIGVSIHPALK
jgi:hypothetical protein